MRLFLYFWSKLFKKIRASAIRNSFIHKSSTIESGSLIVNSSMDRHSFCGYNCEITNADIGSFCSIANGVIIGGGMHPLDWISTSPAFYSGRDSIKAKFSAHDREAPKKVTIEHDIWIGQNVLIKQGVHIGVGAIIGMGSVVTKDVPPYAVVGGSPARIIKYRFDQDLISRLVKSKWWKLDDSKLSKIGHLSKDPESFLKAIEK